MEWVLFPTIFVGVLVFLIFIDAWMNRKIRAERRRLLHEAKYAKQTYTPTPPQVYTWHDLASDDSDHGDGAADRRNDDGSGLDGGTNDVWKEYIRSLDPSDIDYVDENGISNKAKYSDLDDDGR